MTDGFRRFLDAYSEASNIYIHTHVESIKGAIAAFKILKMNIYNQVNNDPMQFMGEVKVPYKNGQGEDEKALIELENKAMTFLISKL